MAGFLDVAQRSCDVLLIIHALSLLFYRVRRVLIVPV